MFYMMLYLSWRPTCVLEQDMLEMVWVQQGNYNYARSTRTTNPRMVRPDIQSILFFLYNIVSSFVVSLSWGDDDDDDPCVCARTWTSTVQYRCVRVRWKDLGNRDGTTANSPGPRFLPLQQFRANRAITSRFYVLFRCPVPLSGIIRSHRLFTPGRSDLRFVRADLSKDTCFGSSPLLAFAFRVPFFGYSESS